MPITHRHVVAAAVAASLLGACSERPPPDARMASNVGEDAQALETENGINNNGINNNGINNNGLAPGGVGSNGLAVRGLYDGPWYAEFDAWYQKDPAYAEMVMTYAVRCALYDGDWTYYWDPRTGQEHWWWGKLGLAPDWGYGAPSEYDEQIVTACMASLTNKYGQHVSVSLQGRNAYYESIPLAPGELTTYAFKEGCFFGNLFRGQGVYAGLDHGAIAANASSLRACALDPAANGTSTTCAPIQQVGTCSAYCTKANTNAYASCTYGGRTYAAITTRLKPSAIVTCGDGVCQASEKCGTTTSPKACVDCGPCK